jgi:GntR family transcriptional regulator
VVCTIEARSPRYLRIRDQLAADVADGDLAAGALLPSEGDLATRYGASRLTVRKALALLKEEGVLTSRQGLGWSVTGDTPMRQPLDSLISIDEQITRAGRRPGRRLLTFSVGPPPPHVMEILAATSAMQVARLNLADNEPVGRNTAWVPEDLARHLSLDRVEAESLLHLLPVLLGSATQVITAEGASDVDAALLEVTAGSPLLRFNRTTHDRAGRPVLYSEAVYNPLRTEFTVELAAPLIAG